MFHLPDMLQFDGNFEKIILPKKIYIKSLKKLMNCRDTFDKDYIRKKSENKSNFNDIEIIENTPDEIYSASIEMYDLIVDKKNSKVDQEEFYNIFEKFYSNSLVKKTMISLLLVGGMLGLKPVMPL